MAPSLGAPSWRATLENARATLSIKDVSDASLEAMALACESPAKLQTLVRLFYQHAKSKPHLRCTGEEFLKRVSDSAYSLAQWINALCEFAAWIKKNGGASDLSTMLGYLECTAASAEAKAGGQTLGSLLAQMLASFGYRG